MSFGQRLKERRESLGMTRLELAHRLGVTQSAISNYENGVSAPKTELLYTLFDLLQCDANYLYQDVMHYTSAFTASLAEWELIHKYRELTEHGRAMVDLVLEQEHRDAAEKRPLTFEVAARTRGDLPGELHLKNDFDPDAIENGVDF